MLPMAVVSMRALHLYSPFLSSKFPNGVSRFSARSFGKSSVFLKRPPSLENGILTLDGAPALVGVPENVSITPCSESSAFLGANCDERKSRHVFKIGGFQNARFLSLFRFKIWWMIPRMGNCARDIPIETQFLLMEAMKEGSCNDNAVYALFLPILDGEFRSSLQGNIVNELQVCVESGNCSTTESEFPRAVFMNSGDNPFELIKESMMILQKYTGTFTLREMKQASQCMPGILDWFGWCTWDAFYQDVNPQGIKDGLKTLSEGGTPAKFLIIDDGWQDTANEFRKGETFIEGSQFGARLMSIKENSKFRRTEVENSENIPLSLKDFVSEMKTSFGLKHVYMWHALLGYWGGLQPDSPTTKKYNPTLKFPVQSPGNLSHQRDIAMDCMEKYGVGFVDPNNIHEFYNDLHGYLVSQGVDGVKVDVQNVLETLATGYGGRVLLTRKYQEALEKSILGNFKDNNIICCMSQSTDSVYSWKSNAVARASDDYYPKNPKTQTLHIASVAYNSLFFGEFVVPDWDMFYSLHETAEFHAVARAVGGCGVYVSDKPGKHDFEILKRLVLPDGSVLRAKYPGRPSRDCLFADPVSDGKSLLKIWNMNNLTGVIGIFNCQGAGTWPGLDDDCCPKNGLELSGYISPSDIEFISEIISADPPPSGGDFAVFSFKSGSLAKLPLKGKLHLNLKTLDCDALTVSPIKVYGHGIQFAPLGLINMYNSGGAITAIDSVLGDGIIRVTGRGGGIFGSYSNLEPKHCTVNEKTIEFQFNREEYFLKLDILRGVAAASSWEIMIRY
ncbi:hypothetical protein M569_07242 [Genlisea aurea]|uniref:galactinol--sucrose galactosyltransferase n=1 Tax=Genlisea aurea TaxID=192259 RepID=S8DWG6_9LAMI|nr:hypothetical protein M569_07242 [Genlisea aurea]